MPQSREDVDPTAPGVRTELRVGRAVLVVLVICYAVSTLPGLRSAAGFDTGFEPVLDGWLRGAAYVVAAGLVLLRLLPRHRDHSCWAWISAGVVVHCAGLLGYLAVVRLQESAPVLSVTDVLTLTATVIFLVGLVSMVRDHRPRRSRTLVLDALLGALAVASVALAVFHDPLRLQSPSGTRVAVVAVEVAHVLVDVALLVVIVGVLSVMRWRPPTRAATAIAGLVGLVLVDAVSLCLRVLGELDSGTPLGALGALSLAATAAVAWSTWLPEAVSRHLGPDDATSLVGPAGSALVCLGTLLYGTTAEVPVGSGVLAACGLLVAAARVHLTALRDREEAGAALALKDAEVERFSALVEASRDFIALAHPDGAVSYLNPGGRRMVGLEPDFDVTRTVIPDYLTDEGRAAIKETGGLRVLTDGEWHGESALRDFRGGPPIPVTVSTFLVRHPETREPWLLGTVQRDISERLRAEQTALGLAEERQALLAHLIEAQETERARIAADVHDDSVQSLAVVDLQLGLLRRRLGEDASEDVLATVDLLHDSVGKAIDRLRHLLFDLDSPAQRSDLVTAVRDAAATLLEGRVRWRVFADADVDLPEAGRVMAHRMAKEAMVNVVKHAQATTVAIDIRHDGEGVTLAVSDDGIGVGPDAVAARPGHRGLADLHDRARLAGGSLSVGPREEGGTTVRVWLPRSAGRY